MVVFIMINGENSMSVCVPLTREMLPNRVSVNTGSPVTDFQDARRLADQKAAERLAIPMLLAWSDSKAGKFSPNIVCCQEHKPSWLVYAETRGGELSIDINDLEYVFVYRQG